ncbi:NAD-dependent epimerase/dehydratase family protein [Kitasatospora sp. NPDC127111]|uniref:NAD-dependent epimerase/dehydratase family protein n=1 Tax=Kitasatospora sp. NPDC127111 TaxID=3345363 RepID=UPI00363EF841
MRVVVTGGAGFIGADLVRALLTRPEVDQVRVVDDPSTGGTASPAGTDAVLYEGSVLEPALLDEAFGGADAVVHLAAPPSVPRSAEDPPTSHHANAADTLEVLEAARRAGGLHVAAASSSSVHGANHELPEHERCGPRR